MLVLLVVAGTAIFAKTNEPSKNKKEHTVKAKYTFPYMLKLPAKNQENVLNVVPNSFCNGKAANRQIR